MMILSGLSFTLLWKSLNVCWCLGEIIRCEILNNTSTVSVMSLSTVAGTYCSGRCGCSV